MKIFHPCGRPSMVRLWQQPTALRLSLSAPAALVASAPRAGACGSAARPGAGQAQEPHATAGKESSVLGAKPLPL